MFAILNRIFGNDGDASVIGDSGALFQAILERSSDDNYLVILGEPELVDRGGPYNQDFRARIPTETVEGDPDPPNLEYPLPEGEDTDSPLYDLLDLYGIDMVADLDELDGEVVPATLEGGNLTLQFEKVDGQE